jgi:phasin family protein
MTPHANPFAAFQTFPAFKAPTAFDASAVSAFYQQNYQKTFETLVQANLVLTEGARAVATRNTAILTDVVAEAPGALRSVVEGKNPNEVIATQADIMKRGIERAMANARELAEIVATAQSEAVDIIAKRVATSLDEVAGAARQSSLPAAKVGVVGATKQRAAADATTAA